MKPVFDDSGLATQAGNIRVFYFDAESGEYRGWSDEFINLGVSMPGNSTDINPGNKVDGKVSVFTGTVWEQYADHRGDTVYSTTDGSSMTVDYIGDIRDGYTSAAPATPYDKWDGKEWVTDTDTRYAADVAAAESQKQHLIAQANIYMNSKQWPGKAAMGRLTDSEEKQYNGWLDYFDALEAVNTSTAPDIEWPSVPVS